MTRYYAHSHQTAPAHGLATHLEDTAERAASLASKFLANDWARVAGLLHDIGKYSATFQRRVRGSGERVDHATAGAQLATAKYGAVGKLLAYAIAGHHGGMPDASGGADGASTLADRLHKVVDDFSSYQHELVLPPSLPPPLWLKGHPTAAARRLGFSLHVLGRLVFSTLVDADFMDTEQYYGQANRTDISRGSPHSLGSLARCLREFLAVKMAKAPATDVNIIRAEILAAVRERMRDIPGLFTLSVPTGGGKTLASLDWALGHARAHGKDRVIYVIPYMSIIEQTAAVFREALGDSYADAVLEHHSSYRESCNLEAEAKLARNSENWDSPVVVTTAVQFFESLFSNRPSRCRKLHNIANSVIILDEAQTLPPQLLRPCVAMLDELARNYATSVLLCTATQPALVERVDDVRSLSGGFIADEVRELIPTELRLHERLRRVVVQQGGTMSDADLAAALGSVDRALCIVNTRRHARNLFQHIAGLEGAAHLSALMYPAHRSRRLDDVRDRLKKKLPVRLITTTVIEAGVDVDFASVWRAMTGLDSIAQAAGRCNREGHQRRAESVVTIFDPQDPQMTPQHVRASANATRFVLQHHADNPLSPRAIETYFRSYYWRRDSARGGLDRGDIMGLLEGAHVRHDYPYATIAELVRLIDDAGIPIIVPAEPDAFAIIHELQACAERSPAEARKLYRRAQHYTVQVPQKIADDLRASGSIVHVWEGPEDQDIPLMLADLSHYSEDVGLDVL